MHHADASSLPSSIATGSKRQLYEHAIEQLQSLIEPDDHWISVLSNAASLLYHLLNEWSGHRINWCGFYLDATLLGKRQGRLLLGPFQGKTACQFVSLAGRLGVCASAYTEQKTIIVPDVHAREGHIACDAATKSEIVVPLGRFGVLDLDATELATFDAEDAEGLERLVLVILGTTTLAAPP